MHIDHTDIDQSHYRYHTDPDLSSIIDALVEEAVPDEDDTLRRNAARDVFLYGIAIAAHIEDKVVLLDPSKTLFDGTGEITHPHRNDIGAGVIILDPGEYVALTLGREKECLDAPIKMEDGKLVNTGPWMEAWGRAEKALNEFIER